MRDFKIPGRCKALWAVTHLAGCFAAISASAPAAETTATWAHYFPNHPAAPGDAAGWADLARTLPTRVKPALPGASESLKSPPATRTELRPGIGYVRVRQLANDLAVIESALSSQPRLIIDLRYVRAELDEAVRFGALLARNRLVLENSERAIEPTKARASDQVTLCLINRATAGPLEAVLDALQNSGAVLLVGTQSAGDTGKFVTVPDAPDWRMITSDYRREDGPSLLDVGATPGLFVETAPDVEDAAYLAFDAGRPVADLLDAPVEKTRFDEARLQQHFDETRPGNGNGSLRAKPATPATGPEKSDGDKVDEKTTDTEDADAKKAAADGEPPPFDRSLQRAVSTLVAHDALRGTKAHAR